MSRIDPVSDCEEADRGEAALDERRKYAPRRPAVAANLEAMRLDRPQPRGCSDDAVGQVIVAGAAVGDEKNREGGHCDRSSLVGQAGIVLTCATDSILQKSRSA